MDPETSQQKCAREFSQGGYDNFVRVVFIPDSYEKWW